MSGDVFDGQWRLLNDDPELGVRRWVLDLDDGNMVLKTEWYSVDQHLERNKQLFNDSLNKRWGEGQIAASVPMHIWARELAPARKAGDDAYIKRWLNDPDHRAFRTFRGRV